ncbi:MAG: 4-hydroxy-3-methylbut-2-enyl diphosphate reductase [Paludibacteraceae bacterium]|jgi:4-hydroxy-3-methylbut-2-enyl diphosphate reductase|nr:4-hydroxy-3-methylbut-2-enyl diphosphate reductase [Paludibacteraceae bacterium]MDI9537536.1 4-hydroxy-3-methylbut-2-enyl diphosphate reductase [Bacteroidota bacterium]OQC34588.1 MAG: 4-hydroxy-3-methylbut-2-enyl diphosphate reductase [Bacteroidetes bacterium ADurb.Bin057]HHT61039.1 4-hydroxy-3-methylbut-2-enyl diphosphate reductase [Bacteroidales bacterium]MBP9038938.1 4-hydroxy-3-methylbut-2-enyl diphosphate reductase [Paludibacteraceae bacterium]
MKIKIDESSGFCFGVVNAIKKAEQELETSSQLFCLGDIVHNGQEVRRLASKGLKTIEHAQLELLFDEKILFRAHGEPPSTYALAERHRLKVIDATCPVVLMLQKKIKKAYQENAGVQIVIYGKIGHAEVNGLVGQTDGTAIVIEGEQDLDKIDFSKDILLFSQTTKSVDGFNRLVAALNAVKPPQTTFRYFDTICRQVASRIPNIREFAAKFDLVFFVSGTKSSNGRVLFRECKQVNPNSYFISDLDEIDFSLLTNVKTIGICGATSTPKWLMEQVAETLERYAAGK